MSAIRPRGRLLRISRGGMALPAAPERDEDLRPSAGGQELLPPKEARVWVWGQVGGRGGRGSTLGSHVLLPALCWDGGGGRSLLLARAFYPPFFFCLLLIFFCDLPFLFIY